MSNLSELLPAGAGAKSATFVASGTLPSGQAVALKTNGQVEAISVGGGSPSAVRELFLKVLLCFIRIAQPMTQPTTK